MAEARRAIDAILAEAMKQPDRPVAAAVVDDAGRLVAFARMDGCRPMPHLLAFKKAYTAALVGSDTAAYAERMKSTGRTVGEMGDSNLTSIRGGVCIERSKDKLVLGGIGVSGLRGEEDEELSRVGVRAMGA
jgi:glc operon protein GlcG